MEASHNESRQGPRAPKHSYSLADYGLTAEQVRERFTWVVTAGRPVALLTAPVGNPQFSGL
jgi:hypothetical protein